MMVTFGGPLRAQHERSWTRHQTFTTSTRSTHATELHRNYRTDMGWKQLGQAIIAEQELSFCDQVLFCITTDGAPKPVGARL